MAHLPHWAGITGKTLPNRYTNTPQNYPQSRTQMQYLGYAKKQSTGIDGLQMLNVLEKTDCVKCGNYTTVLEQVQAVKTGKMLCEYCR